MKIDCLIKYTKEHFRCFSPFFYVFGNLCISLLKLVETPNCGSKNRIFPDSLLNWYHKIYEFGLRLNYLNWIKPNKLPKVNSNPINPFFFCPVKGNIGARSLLMLLKQNINLFFNHLLKCTVEVILSLPVVLYINSNIQWDLCYHPMVKPF